MKATMAVAFLLCSFAGLFTAHADYSVSANSCVPDSTTINTIDYIQDTSVRHNSGEEDVRIQLRCMVPSDVGTITHISATMKETDGSANYQVKVHLRRISKSTGSDSVIATLDSDDYASTTGGAAERTLDIVGDHTPNFSTHFYFIEIEVWRNAQSWTPRAYGVTLEE